MTLLSAVFAVGEPEDQHVQAGGEERAGLGDHVCRVSQRHTSGKTPLVFSSKSAFHVVDTYSVDYPKAEMFVQVILGPLDVVSTNLVVNSVSGVCSQSIRLTLE